MYNGKGRKINVKLAAKLLSESVSQSLRFCLNEHIREFYCCEATIDFIMLFNSLFDIMNTTNFRAVGYKSPMKRNNASKIKIKKIDNSRDIY